MARFISVFLVLLFLVSTAIGAPSIGNISDNTPGNDQSITITGTGFTSHNLDIEWLGGSSGNIESGTAGAAFSGTNWVGDATNSATQAPLYSADRSHSGSQSIMSSFPLESQYDSGFEYQHGADFTEIYATWWVYFDDGPNLTMGGQWKRWRIRTTGGYDNDAGEIMESIWLKALNEFGERTLHQAYDMILCDVSSYGQCYEDGTGDDRWIALQPTGAWYRYEVYARASSTAGTADAIVDIRYNDMETTSTEVFSYDQLITRLTENDKWNRFTFQNYWGNQIAGEDGGDGDGTSEKIYIDDIYIQIGDRAHIMVGNNATYASCTHLEIQHPTAWSTTSITFDINQGSFASDSTGYVFVIDSSGVASTGKQVTFGEGGSSVAASIARTETGSSMVKSGTGCSFTKGE